MSQDELLEFVKNELDREDVTLEAKFSELDLDSLDFMDLMQQVEIRFGVKYNDLDIARLVRVEDFARYAVVTARNGGGVGQVC